MSKHLNPLEKEFPRWQYKSNSRIKMSNFCKASIFPFRTMFPHCTDDRRKSLCSSFSAWDSNRNAHLPRIRQKVPELCVQSSGTHHFHKCFPS